MASPIHIHLLLTLIPCINSQSYGQILTFHFTKMMRKRKADRLKADGEVFRQIIIINRMFILSNIKVNTSEILFFPDSRKFLKFQINKSTKKHPFPSKFVSPHEIHWDAELTFPQALYGRAMAFEIYIRHQFGYHEEEFSSMLQGQMKVERDASVYTFEVHRAEATQCIGYLSCRVRHKGETVEEVIETKIARKQTLIIRSIIAHVPSAVNKKIACVVAVGKQEMKTASVRTLCGDLVFPDRMFIHKTDLEKGDVKLGEGRIHLIGQKPEKKVILMNLKEQVCGQAYVDCIQEEEGESRLKSSSLPSYLHKIKPSQQMMKETSMTGRSHFKKISVVSPNQSIIFSTSQRFKQTNNPQFLGTRSSNRSKMSFGLVRASRKQSRSRQAGLFSIEEQTPGVGRYKLPTIWDRY